MTRLAPRGRVTKLAALAVAALTSVAMFSTPSNAATPTAKPGRPTAAKVTVTSGRPRTAPATPRPVDLQILALNDFHGQLEAIPSTSSSGRINTTPAGGAEYLATHLQQLRDQATARGAHTITVAAGDLVGATPLLSAAFYDEPTIGP